MTIILVGLPYVGKTTLGRKLAQKVELPFIDTDQEIEKRDAKNRSCREIFFEEGEAHFRRAEERAVLQLTFPTDCVAATGGGAILNPKVVQRLKEQGQMIYLRADPHWLYQRVEEEAPAYLSQEFSLKEWMALATARTPLYEQQASIAFSVDQLDESELLNQLERLYHG